MAATCVALLIWLRSWAVHAYEWLFDQPDVFSRIAAVIAAVLVAFPLRRGQRAACAALDDRNNRFSFVMTLFMSRKLEQ
ncbi:hypothetical protein [Paenibacillus sp. FJAT-27812]|uniref:hypothetical protein n=1 Tax=Paenibacillus sp. FJAT-27812 TaxID=1684143 RepID=UPI0006A7A9C8|nr:hypothetical protein [Paenibacillus sp. FJAT-27812]